MVVVGSPVTGTRQSRRSLDSVGVDDLGGDVRRGVARLFTVGLTGLDVRAVDRWFYGLVEAWAADSDLTGDAAVREMRSYAVRWAGANSIAT
jgi:hypothetical protein